MGLGGSFRFPGQNIATVTQNLLPNSRHARGSLYNHRVFLLKEPDQILQTRKMNGVGIARKFLGTVENARLEIYPKCPGRAAPRLLLETRGGPFPIYEMLERIHQAEGLQFFPEPARSMAKKNAGRHARARDEFRADDAHQSARAAILPEGFQISGRVGDVFQGEEAGHEIESFRQWRADWEEICPRETPPVVRQQISAEIQTRINAAVFFH